MSEAMADFEKEIEASFRKLNKGDVLDGTITSVDDDAAYIDINYHAQGIVRKKDFSDDPAFSMQSLNVGDTVKVVVVSDDDGEGNVLLSAKDAAKAVAWENARKYLEDGTIVTVKVQEAVKAGVIAYLEGLRAFIPASHLSTKYVEDTNEFLDKTVDALVITADEEKNRLVLSIKKATTEKRRAEITIGSVIEGEVESLMPYGAFIDLGGGISGLVHISRISRKRIETPAEVLKKGQTVKVKVIKNEGGKISLSMRDLEEGAPVRDRDGGRSDERLPRHYKDEGTVGTGLGSLLAGIKLDN